MLTVQPSLLPKFRPHKYFLEKNNRTNNQKKKFILNNNTKIMKSALNIHVKSLEIFFEYRKLSYF